MIMEFVIYFVWHTRLATSVWSTWSDVLGRCSYS